MEKVQELQRLVVELYDSFENDNRKGVEEIRQVLANVNEKYKTSSHPLAWTGRLVLYLQVNACEKRLIFDTRTKGYYQGNWLELVKEQI